MSADALHQKPDMRLSDVLPPANTNTTRLTKNYLTTITPNTTLVGLFVGQSFPLETGGIETTPYRMHAVQ